MSGSGFGRNELSYGTRVNDAKRFRTSEIVLARSTTDGSVTDFQARFSVDLDQIVKVELVEYSLTGVPVTGTTPDYPYFRLDLGQLESDSYTNAQGSGLFLFTAANGPNEHKTYSPPRLVKLMDSPTRLRDLRVRVSLPNNTTAVSGTDITGVYLVFRVWQDLNSQKLR